MVSKKLEIRARELRIFIYGMNLPLLKKKIGLGKSKASFFIETDWAMDLARAPILGRPIEFSSMISDSFCRLSRMLSSTEASTLILS